MAIHNSQPSLLGQVQNIITTYKGTVGEGMTLADVTKVARVEPLTLISSSLTGTKELYTILHGVLNIYAAYYLQAVNILASQLTDNRILKILDKTNPDRDIKTFLTTGQLAFESYQEPSQITVKTNGAHRTMTLDNAKFKLPFVRPVGVPALESNAVDNFGYDLDHDEYTNHQSLGAQVGKIESFDKLGLTVGKIIDVSFSTGSNEKGGDKSKATIPVVVKLDTMIIPGDALARITTANESDITFTARTKDAFSGRIPFIKDYLLCLDMIKSQKRAMIKDPSGHYAALIARLNNSKFYSALTGNVSLSGISGIYVMSEEDENEIQKKIGGRLTNASTREKVFKNISAMMIVVVDKEWERVSIYVRDIDGFSQSSFDSFKRSDDKGTTQIADILKAFTLNNPPSF